MSIIVIIIGVVMVIVGYMFALQPIVSGRIEPNLAIVTLKFWFWLFFGGGGLALVTFGFKE